LLGDPGSKFLVKNWERQEKRKRAKERRKKGKKEKRERVSKQPSSTAAIR
jgi:hypothetical protein